MVFYKICGIGIFAAFLIAGLTPKENVEPQGYYGVKNTSAFLIGEMPAPKI